MDGLSLCMHKSRKLWFLFPPTDHNLKLMKIELGQNAKLWRVGARMEGGVVCETTDKEAIYLPAGCIHAVFTLDGGFLVSLDFTTRDSVSVFGRYLAQDLHLAMDEESQRNCLFSYIESLEVALHNQRAVAAVESWLKLEPRLQRTATQDFDWCQTAKTCWVSFLDTTDAMGVVCPCGRVDTDVSFSDHMKASHLRLIMTACRAAPSRRRQRR